MRCAGNGSYGGVAIWLAQHVPSGQLMAVKSVDFDKCELPYSLVQVSALYKKNNITDKNNYNKKLFALV